MENTENMENQKHIENQEQTTSTQGAERTVANSPRLAEFQQEVAKMGVTGGRANPERQLLRASVVLMLAGLVVVIVAFVISSGTALGLEGSARQTDMIILSIMGMSLILLGGIFYVSHVLTRFLRYWLVRLIFEQRDQTDRLVDK